MVNLHNISPPPYWIERMRKGCVIERVDGGSQYWTGSSSSNNWYNNGLEDLMAPLKSGDA